MQYKCNKLADYENILVTNNDINNIASGKGLMVLVKSEINLKDYQNATKKKI